MADEIALEARDGWLTIRRGLRRLCPACGEALHHHRADDFPSYLNVILVGHVMVPLVLAVETAFSPPYWVHASTWLPLTLILAFALMHPINGAVVAWQWALRMHGFDPKADPDDPVTAPMTPKCPN